MKAFERYGGGHYEFVDASDVLADKHFSLGNHGFDPGNVLVERIKQQQIDLVFAEMGVGDYQVFHAMLRLKALVQDVATLVTIHDPPRTVVNLNPIFYSYQSMMAVRAVRWLYNRTLGRRIERSFLSQHHHWLLLSEKGKQLWQQQLDAVGSLGYNLSVIPHLNYSDMSMELPSRLPGRAVCLGVLGSITRSKGIDILIGALDLCAKRGMLPTGLMVEIAGEPLYRQDHSYLDELKGQVSRLGLESHVRFTGFIPDGKLADFFSRIDLLVLPYRETGSGSASGPLMWARSFGVPVVASCTRNLPEMVQQNRDGLLFEPSDVDALAESLLYAWQASNFALLRDGARRRREDCSWQECTTRMIELFDRIIASQGNGIPT
jgi:glycosyltransferase involved in cell wall biosynthesis